MRYHAGPARDPRPQKAPIALKKQDVSVVDLVMGGVIVTSAVMLVQLACGRFEPSTAGFLGVMLTAVAAFALAGRIAPIPVRVLAIAVLAGLFALFLRWSPFLYSEGGQDQGVYMAMSSHYTRAHSHRIVDTVREALPESQRADYDKFNNTTYAAVPGRYEGVHQPGVYIENLAKSTYVFQFYQLHPLWMSLFGWALGEENRVYSLVFLSVLGIVMLSLLAYEMAGRVPAAGFIAAALLCVNPVNVFLSRFPVSENVTLLFSAAALYYTLRFFRAQSDGRPAALDGVLATGAWAGSFFTHISGFFYGPVLLPIMLAGVAAARDARSAKQAAWLGIGVTLAYSLSLAYGMAISFPYSFDVYRTLFGEPLGRFMIDGWWLLCVLALFGFIVLAWLAAASRERIASAWTARRLSRHAVTGLLAAIGLLALYATFRACRLAFTDYYAQELWVTRFSLSHAGWNSLVHSSMVALVVYTTPFVFALVLAMAWVRRATLSLEMVLGLVAIVGFMVIRIGMELLTPYYFYTRYLGVELVPLFIVVAAVFLSSMLRSAQHRVRHVAVTVLALALAWQAVALEGQYPGGEMYRVEASTRPLAQRLRDEDVLLYASGDYPALQTGIDYYFGKRSVRVDGKRLREAVRRYAAVAGDVYILSDVPTLDEGQYVAAHTILHDTYRRDTAWNILPRDASLARQFRFYLYRVDRRDLAVLRSGDAVTFDRLGNATQYLVDGWSGQEEFIRWTEGTKAAMRLPLAEGGGPFRLEFDVRAYNCVPVDVKVNGKPRAHWIFKPDCGAFVTQVVGVTPEDLQAARGNVEITFDMPEAKSPAEVNPALSDRRRLGISPARMDILDASAGTPAQTAAQKR